MEEIRLLAEWPLSKVELVTGQGQTFIRKTIHADFADEVARQRVMAVVLGSGLAVSKVLTEERRGDKVVFEMEWIDGSAPLPDEEVAAIRVFHSQTAEIRDAAFPKYGLEEFIDDIGQTKELLLKISPAEAERVGAPIFEMPRSIVHGDWKPGQMICKGGLYYVLDFGKSFYGPSVLDLAYYNSRAPEVGIEVDESLRRADFINQVIQLEWYKRCRDRYIPYDYTKEISRTQGRMTELFQGIAVVDYPHS